MDKTRMLGVSYHSNGRAGDLGARPPKKRPLRSCQWAEIGKPDNAETADAQHLFQHQQRIFDHLQRLVQDDIIVCLVREVGQAFIQVSLIDIDAVLQAVDQLFTVNVHTGAEDSLFFNQFRSTRRSRRIPDRER